MGDQHRLGEHAACERSERAMREFADRGSAPTAPGFYSFSGDLRNTNNLISKRQRLLRGRPTPLGEHAACERSERAMREFADRGSAPTAPEFYSFSGALRDTNKVAEIEKNRLLRRTTPSAEHIANPEIMRNLCPVTMPRIFPGRLIIFHLYIP